MAPLKLPQPRTSLHIYRHLLREASYLPPPARLYVSSRVCSRFRQHLDDESPKRCLRHASRHLRNLRAANAGDLARMRKILLLSFGRTGSRRRELMLDLRQREPPANSAELEERLRDVTPAGDWLDKWDTRKLLSFAKNQSRQSLQNSPRPELHAKQLDSSKAVPTLNASGRPFTEKVARTKLKNWWKGVAHRILPPVGKGEWEALRGLALGRTSTELAIPGRRPAARPKDQRGNEAVWQWQRYVMEPIRRVDRPRSRMFKIRFGVDDQDTPGGSGPPLGIHNYTTRSWRRMYAQIWQLTPTVERKQSAATGWNISWGGVHLKPAPSSAAYQEFFEGVDGEGKAPSQPSRAPDEQESHL